MPFSFHNIQLSQWILANETWRGRRLTIMSQISKWIVQKTYPIRYAIRFWHVTSGIKFSKAKDKYQLGTETLWPNNKKYFLSAIHILEKRQLVTCPGFPGYCSEAYPGGVCTVVCAFGRPNVPECQVSSKTICIFHHNNLIFLHSVKIQPAIQSLINWIWYGWKKKHSEVLEIT